MTRADPRANPLIGAIFSLRRLEEFLIEERRILDLVGNAVRWHNLRKKSAGPHPDLGELEAVLEGFDGMSVHLAFHQMDDGSYLLGLATAQVWAVLEAAINDLVSNIRTPDGSKASSSSRLPKSPGSDRFDDALKEAGIDGVTDADVRKVLLELSETRHLLVHRCGVIDEKFQKRCPSVERFGPEGRVKITPFKFRLFLLAATAYITTVLGRLHDAAFDVDDTWKTTAGSLIARLNEMLTRPDVPDPGSIQEWWAEAMKWRDGVPPQNPFQSMDSAPEEGPGS